MHSASLHSAAAFLSSYTSSLQLVEKIIGHPPAPSPHLPSVLLSSSQFTNHPDWTDLENIDIGPSQKALSSAIDDAVFSQLLSTAPDVRAKVLTYSSNLMHAGDWYVKCSPFFSSAPLHVRPRISLQSKTRGLGTPLFGDAYQCPACDAEADTMGDQYVGCGGNGN